MRVEGRPAASLLPGRGVSTGILTEPMMASVFVCYRRRDSSGYTISIVQGIARALGADQVFQDVRSLEGGDPWSEKLLEAIASSKVMIVVIGPGWVKWGAERAQPPALFRGDDPVRQEIIAALARRVMLIPVLVGGARMPATGELPTELRELTSFHAIELSDSRWDRDTEALLQALARTISRNTAIWWMMRALRRLTHRVGSAGGLVVLTAIGFFTSLVLRHVATWPVPPFLADAMVATLLWSIALAWPVAGRRLVSVSPGAGRRLPKGSLRGMPLLYWVMGVLSVAIATWVSMGPMMALTQTRWTFCATLDSNTATPRNLRLFDDRMRPVIDACLDTDDDSGLKMLPRPHWFSYRPAYVSVGCGPGQGKLASVPEEAFNGTCGSEIRSP